MINVGQVGIGVQLDLKQLRASWAAAVGSSKAYADALSKIYAKAVSSPAQMVAAKAAADATTVKAQAQYQTSQIMARARAAAMAVKAPIQAQAAAQAALIKAPLVGQAQARGTIIRARGAARGSQTRARGSARAQMARAQGSVQAQMARANAQVVRAQGQAATQMVAAQGRAAAQMVAVQGQAQAAKLNAQANRIRAILGPVNTLAGSLGRGMIGSRAGNAAFMPLVPGGAMGLSVREAADMESRMAALRRVTGLEGGELEGLGSKLKALATAIPGVGLGEVFDVAKMGARLGIAGDQVGGFTSGILKAKAALDDMPLEQAATGVSRLLNIFRQSPLEAKNLVSVLVALDQKSTATAADLLEISSRLAPMAHVFRMTAQQTLALSAAMKDAGIHSEVAGTAITQVLGRLAESRRRGAFAGIAGMKGDDFNRLVKKSPLEALGAVAKGAAGMEPEKAITMLNRLGLEGQRVRQALLGLGTVWGKMGDYVATANKEMATGAAAERGVTTAAGETWKQLGLVGNAFQLLAADVGKGFLPIVKGAAVGLTDLFADIRDYLKENSGSFVAWGESVGAQIRRVGLLWREFPTVWALVEVRFKEFVDRTAVVFARIERIGQYYVKGTVGYLVDAAQQGGTIFGKTLVNAIIDAIGSYKDKIVGVLKFVDPLAAHLLDSLKKTDVPKFEDRAVRFFNPFLRRAAAPRGVFGNLPNREDEARPLVDKLAQAEKNLAAARQQGVVAAQAAERQALQADKMRMADAFRAQQARAQAQGGQGIIARNRAARIQANRALRPPVRRRRGVQVQPGAGGIAPHPGPLTPKAQAALEEQKRRDEAAERKRKAILEGLPGAAVDRPSPAEKAIAEQKQREAEAKKKAADLGGIDVTGLMEGLKGMADQLRMMNMRGVDAVLLDRA